MDGASSAARRTIERALENVGDKERLAQLLGADVAQLNRWILGKQVPPHEVFLRALDLAFRATLPVGDVPRVQQMKLQPRQRHGE
jgi:DNA-binding transcriptional regulator YdaS (Cro superfamily)